jgi:hypothetical protein
MSGQENPQNTLECEHMPHTCEKGVLPTPSLCFVGKRNEECGIHKRKCIQRMSHLSVNLRAPPGQNSLKPTYRKCTFLCGNRV